MKRRGAAAGRGGVVATALILTAIGLSLAMTVSGCGTAAGPGTLGTVGSTSTSTTAGPTSTAPVGSMSTDTTFLPVTTGTLTTGGQGTSQPTIPADPNKPTTTVLTGTTLPGEGQKFALTFVGPMTTETWKAVRTAVNGAHDDGDKVRKAVAKLSAGPDVSVNSAEFDRFSGIGFSAGASTAQPIAIATSTDGKQVLVYSFTITGKPVSTTIVGFDLETGHVGLVEGPLAISDSTKNVTTVPGQ